MLVNVPNCHLSLVVASVVQGDAVNCNKSEKVKACNSKTYFLREVFIYFTGNSPLVLVCCIGKLCLFTITVFTWHLVSVPFSNVAQRHILDLLFLA